MNVLPCVWATSAATGGAERRAARNAEMSLPYPGAGRTRAVANTADLRMTLRKPCVRARSSPMRDMPRPQTDGAGWPVSIASDVIVSDAIMPARLQGLPQTI